jgi:mannose-6-phosphate isomerase-like protein (cupin superfamily)
MQIIKKSSVPKEPAHGGQGSRQLFQPDKDSSSSHFQAFTKGFLPSNGKFSFHKHDGIEEMMLVLKGNGVVRDRDGEYSYQQDDFFCLPCWS